MASNSSKSIDAHKTRIMLGLLESVERGEAHSQRRLAAELGVALGLVNAYLKRCVSKGLVKVGTAPARRYAYYLTPRGFAEKSRLTIDYLSYSFSLFRQAKKDCTAVLQAAQARGVQRIALAGISDLAEIAAICALDSGMVIVAMVDSDLSQPKFAGVAVRQSFDGLEAEIDAVLVTDIKDTLATTRQVESQFGADRVLIPALLDMRGPQSRRAGR